MSYIGNIPTTASFPFDQFSGTGSQTAFTLSQAPASTSSILVTVSGVTQNPNTYSVSGTTLTFTGAPPSGTNNIIALFLGLPVQIGVPAAGSVTPTSLSTGGPSWDVSGNLTATGNVTAYSDVRLKENIVTINDALSLVGQMRGVSYTRKDTGENQVGVIAQELQKILPEVVVCNNDVYAVAYGNIVGVLIEAIKELKAEVEALKQGA